MLLAWEGFCSNVQCQWRQWWRDVIYAAFIDAFFLITAYLRDIYITLYSNDTTVSKKITIDCKDNLR